MTGNRPYITRAWERREGDSINEPLCLSVELLATCQSGLAVWLGSSAFGRLAIFRAISMLMACDYNA